MNITDTELRTWFERDRAHVCLINKVTGKTIIEWWDEDVENAFEDGFLRRLDLHASAFEQAEIAGLIPACKECICGVCDNWGHCPDHCTAHPEYEPEYETTFGVLAHSDRRDL